MITTNTRVIKLNLLQTYSPPIHTRNLEKIVAVLNIGKVFNYIWHTNQLTKQSINFTCLLSFRSMISSQIMQFCQLWFSHTGKSLLPATSIIHIDNATHLPHPSVIYKLPTYLILNVHQLHEQQP